MKLYGYYRSSASYRIRIILNLKQVSWQYESVMLNKGQQKSADFLAVNPSGLVPVLETPDGPLSQSSAIAEYLEEVHPEPALLPAAANQRAHVREMMAIIGCDVHPLQNLRVLNWLRDEADASDAQVTRWIHRWMGDGFRSLEERVNRHSADGRFCLGATPTLADAWLIPQMYNARRFDLDLAPYPALKAIDAHCVELPAFASARPEIQPDAPA